MSSKDGNIGIQKKNTKWFSIKLISDPQTVNQVGVYEKMTEKNSVDDHRVWLCIRVTFSSIGKVFGLPAD